MCFTCIAFYFLSSAQLIFFFGLILANHLYRCICEDNLFILLSWRYTCDTWCLPCISLTDAYHQGVLDTWCITSTLWVPHKCIWLTSALVNQMQHLLTYSHHNKWAHNRNHLVLKKTIIVKLIQAASASGVHYNLTSSRLNKMFKKCHAAWSFFLF